MSAMDAFWAAPPVTRTLTAATVAITALCFTGLLSGYWVVFLPHRVFQLWLPQPWRLVTAFLITGPKLDMIMEPYFLYTYGAALETGNARFPQTADFLTFIAFICSVIVATAGFYLKGIIFLPALTLALAYIYAQENPEAQMTFYIITFRVKFLPYSMLLMTFIMRSPEAALLQSTGLLAGHLYDFLTRVYPTFGSGVNYIQTPRWLSNLLARGPGASTNKTYGTAFQAKPSTAQAQNSTQPSRGWTSGFGSNAWGNRGPGRRLG